MMRPLLILTLLLATCSSVGNGSQASLPTTDGHPELPEYAQREDIVVHTGYTASYNHTTLLPDWVAWELTAEEADGQMEGQFSFSRDPDVAFPKASREDYSRSGWDKGHMAPRADMKWSLKAMEESYYFTNVCPQDHEMNSGAWRKIEEQTRRLARRYGSVYVVCGPVCGTGHYGTIGAAGVQVPDAFFKALAVQTPDGFATVGFLVENSRQDGSPRRYAVTVDSVETLIGRNLFPSVPEAAEAAFDWKLWSY